MSLMNWIPIIGSFECDNGDVVFNGGDETTHGEPGRALGNALCEERPAGGTIAADITFSEVHERTA